MKTLALFLGLSSSVFAQRHFSPSFHQSSPTFFRPPVVVSRPIVVRPFVGQFNYGIGYGYNPYFYGNPYLYNSSLPCKKEKLKDADGTKHEVLVCLQKDGTYSVVAASK